MIVLFTSLRKDQQQIAKAEFYNIVVSLFLDKWLLDELAASLDEELRGPNKYSRVTNLR